MRFFLKVKDGKMTANELLGQKLILPCGSIVKNRFMKSAMSEALGSREHGPTKNLETLYRTWSKGGSGILVTGNVMIDARHLGEPGNVVVEDERHLEKLSAWAKAGKTEGNHIWMQINHPGKQSPSQWNKFPVAPSAIPLGMKSFHLPRALTTGEIHEIVERFGTTAKIAKKAGFTGVQIHAAHGYLISQFLSSHHNQRKDDYGGSFEKRTRFLEEVYLSIRKGVGAAFPVAIKLNSADFQRGGFTEEESLKVISKLTDIGIDSIEVSGGNYESPAMMMGKAMKDSTRKREAYFLSFASKVKTISHIPLTVTGGFRTSKAMAEAIAEGGCDLIGIARPMVLAPDLPNQILAGKEFVSEVSTYLTTGFPAIDRMLMINLTWYTRQLAIMGKGKSPRPDLHPLKAALALFLSTGWQNFTRTRT